jgi:hypothetical protein
MHDVSDMTRSAHTLDVEYVSSDESEKSGEFSMRGIGAGRCGEILRRLRLADHGLGHAGFDREPPGGARALVDLALALTLLIIAAGANAGFRI